MHDDREVVYPPHLELQQVQILIRHGERTPTSARFQNAGLAADWSYCEAARKLTSVILTSDGWQSLAWQRELETVGAQDIPTMKAAATCLPSELTDRGRQTTLNLGQHLRSLYVARLGFLPQHYDQSHIAQIRLRSTPRERALTSIQQVFAGLYPSAFRWGSPPAVAQRSMHEETLTPNEAACARLAELGAAFAERTARLWNRSPEMEYINQKIGKWMPEQKPVQLDSHPRLSGIMDTIHTTLAHGPATRLPPDFYDAKVLANIDRIVTEEWFAGFQESNEFRRLGIGGLLGDITQHMVERCFGTVNFKLGLYGCHDTTIGGTLASLGIFDYRNDGWPKFTSTITFELFQATAGVPLETETSKDLNGSNIALSSTEASAREPLASMSVSQKGSLHSQYVRVQYNGRPMRLPFCRVLGRHLPGDDSFCTLLAFKEATDSMTPGSWKRECTANLGTPPFPKLVELPPGVNAKRESSI